MTTGTYYWQLDQESLEETSSILQTHLDLKPGSSEFAQDATTN